MSPVLREGGTRILIVDDDLDNARSLYYLLTENGHRVEYAINGIAALHVAQRFRPQVVLLDLKLPDTHGAEVARQMKTHPELKSVRIIAITGSPHRADIDRALAAGCDEAHVKPITVEELDAAVQRHKGE